MKLRRLQLKDAPFMLEWMHDSSVVAYLQTNFSKKNLADCKDFINNSFLEKENLHLAIVDDMDMYMGTVSLKYITSISAEFAITIRKSAMGKGYSCYAMEKIIRLGLEEMGLQCIYWYVLADNIRAIRFYDKNGYQRVYRDDLDFLDELCVPYNKDGLYVWYRIQQADMGINK